MTATVPTVTIEEFLALPDTGVRRELVRGEVREMSPTQLRHSKVLGRLVRLIGNYADDGDRGMYGSEAGFLLQSVPPTLLAPDVYFISASRAPAEEELDQVAAFAPDLAVEIMSPSNTSAEMTGKLLLYLEAGVRMVWIVEPRPRTISVYTPDRDAHLYVDGETIEGGDVLPGFALALSDVFA